MNVFSNFIPNKLVTFNDKVPPWMSEYFKNKINWCKKIYAEYLNENNKSVDYITLQNVIAEVLELVRKSKDDYHKQLARKLTNSKTSSKTYWSILKIFYNGNKVPLIPPLVINKNLEPDFKRKQITSMTFLLQNAHPFNITAFYLPYLNMSLKLGSPKLLLLMTKY